MADDPAFSLVPIEDEVGAEEDLDAAAESALENVYGATEAKDPPIPFGNTWAFDHQLGRFIRSAGSPAQVSGAAALIEYIQTSMRTAAGVHPIFPPDFGIERPEDFLGSADPTEALSDFEDRLRTALLAHDRIEDVRNFEAEIDLAQGSITVTNLIIITDQAEVLPLAPFDVEPEAV